MDELYFIKIKILLRMIISRELKIKSQTGVKQLQRTHVIKYYYPKYKELLKRKNKTNSIERPKTLTDNSKK